MLSKNQRDSCPFGHPLSNRSESNALRPALFNSRLRIKRQVGTHRLGNADHAGLPAGQINLDNHFKLRVEARLVAGAGDADQAHARQNHHAVPPALGGRNGQLYTHLRFHAGMARVQAALAILHLADDRDGYAQKHLAMVIAGKLLPGRLTAGGNGQQGERRLRAIGLAAAI